jgi:putative membrane protein
MIFTWLFGIFLIHSLGITIFSELWMQIKLVLVLILTHFHFYLGKCVKSFASDQNMKSSKFYRIINELPTLLLVIIIFIVIFKPL